MTKGTEDDVSLYVPSNTTVSEWRSVRNDHNLSPHVIGPTDDMCLNGEVCGMTIICLCMSHDRRVSMTEIVGQLTKARLLLLHILNEELKPT